MPRQPSSPHPLRLLLLMRRPITKMPHSSCLCPSLKTDTTELPGGEPRRENRHGCWLLAAGAWDLDLKIRAGISCLFRFRFSCRLRWRRPRDRYADLETGGCCGALGGGRRLGERTENGHPLIEQDKERALGSHAEKGKAESVGRGRHFCSLPACASK